MVQGVIGSKPLVVFCILSPSTGRCSSLFLFMETHTLAAEVCCTHRFCAQGVGLSCLLRQIMAVHACETGISGSTHAIRLHWSQTHGEELKELLTGKRSDEGFQ